LLKGYNFLKTNINFNAAREKFHQRESAHHDLKRSQFLNNTFWMRVKLCDAVIVEELTPTVLEIIGSCLVASDNFVWDNNDPDGNIVAEIVKYWVSSKNHFPLIIKNVKMFREILKVGPSNSRITSDL
jgi:hypothetical protein